jgi:hypothetical protein
MPIVGFFVPIVKKYSPLKINVMIKIIEHIGDSTKTIDEKVSVFVDWMYDKMDNGKYEVIDSLLAETIIRLIKDESFTEHDVIVSILVMSKRFDSILPHYQTLRYIFHTILIKHYELARVEKILHNI